MWNPSMIYIKLINRKEFEVVIKKFAQFAWKFLRCYAR